MFCIVFKTRLQPILRCTFYLDGDWLNSARLLPYLVNKLKILHYDWFLYIVRCFLAKKVSRLFYIPLVVGHRVDILQVVLCIYSVSWLYFASRKENSSFGNVLSSRTLA